MTTNVFDGHVGLIATDSRWSQQYGRWLVYIDDAVFDKIEVANNFAFMFAGSGRLIQEWKNWIRSNPTDDSGQPAVEGISLNGLNMTTKAVRYTEGKSITHESSIFAGSGASHAVMCWRSNRNAMKSVETAKAMDPASGGEVKFLEFSTGNTNLGAGVAVFAPGTIEAVDKAIATRGIYMDLTTRMNGGAPFKISDLAAQGSLDDDAMAEMRTLQEKMASGELSANAPCDAMYSEWTPTAKTELKGFLSEVFGWKK